MNKIRWKPGNMIYPLPAVMISCGSEQSEYNIITIAWTGTVCTDPPMTYISVKPSRHSYEIIKESGAFVINLTTEDMVRGTDYCGVRSGKDEDKAAKMGFTYVATEIDAPLIKESPVNILCQVTEVKKLGSHDMFLAKVVGVYVDGKYMDAHDKFHLDQAGLMAYSHGTYYSLGKKLGTFGYSVKIGASGLWYSSMRRPLSASNLQRLKAPVPSRSSVSNVTFSASDFPLPTLRVHCIRSVSKWLKSIFSGADSPKSFCTP